MHPPWQTNGTGVITHHVRGGVGQHGILAASMVNAKGPTTGLKS